jgi:uncharacterized RDD family membrane protein YckC
VSVEVAPPPAVTSAPVELGAPSERPILIGSLGPLGRRVAAWFIDLGLILAPTMVVAITGGLWLTGLTALLLALILLTLVPANVEGWTPGLRAVGLRVLTTSGHRAFLRHHFVRSVFGLVDLLPFVVPGLLGWFLASRSPLRQRLGDRLARTVVVDERQPERPSDPAEGLRQRRWFMPSAADDPHRPGSASDAAIRWAIDELDAELAPIVPHNDSDGASPAEPTPEWSDDWNGWIVVDAGTGRVYLHEPESGRWLPVA